MQSSDISILTPDYMALLQGLCVNTEPSLNDVTTIFKEFSRSLDARKPKLSPKPSTSSSTSSGASKKRGGKSAARASAASDDADEDGSGILHSDVGFERSLHVGADEKPCWLMSGRGAVEPHPHQELHELREYMWGELVLQGYEWPEQKPGQQDMLRASLLMHGHVVSDGVCESLTMARDD
ncbi:hypothetical protein HPB52_024281 [Rhipicephalus sanguineus]|uniref:Uncharacterized protein n=1 Tax=Rhipicephalus sanguineus TaxID=34632 RepID=A0A9D4TCH9_RHISA|nr:hypothetical protein HPB52_024281 [Rhipicephalus sanguineus]